MTDDAGAAGTLVGYRLVGAVAVLTLRRPESLNALSTPLTAALAAAVRRVAGDPAARALVIAGEGRGFCAGADLAEIESFRAAGEFGAFVGRLTATSALVEELGKPSVAAVHGFALGGGLELALACDLRVVEAGARLGLPEMKLGVLPGAGGTQRLPRVVPPGIARQMILTGEPVTAERAHEVGLANEVAPVGQVLPVALGLAEALARGAPLALAAGKRLLADAGRPDLRSGIARERAAVTVLFDSSDRQEGLAAFRERRPGRFEGR